MIDDPRGRIAVFSGPSLPGALRPLDPAFSWLPPAAAGDAVRLAAGRPDAVVLIDGLFDSVPAIRHKELLNLMAEGIPLIGGASMGALRAAELHSFGMVGVGRIFRAYRAGRLVGDDEVALMHGPADWDWTPLTEALVNVRATVLAAVRARIIELDHGREVITLARGVFYKERTWPGMLRALAGRAGRGGAWIDALAAWLPWGRVDLKRADALECLDVARRHTRPDAPRAGSRFGTVFSRDLARRALGSGGDAAD